MSFDDEKKYEHILDGMKDAVFVHNLDGGFIKVNRAAVERYGYSRDEFMEMTPYELDSEESKPLVEGRLEEIKKRGHLTFKAEHETKDGRKIPVEINSSLIKFKDEKVVLSVARDITERKKAEEELKKSEEKFRSYVENAPSGVFVVDSKGDYLEINESACEMTGYSEKEMLEMNISDITTSNARGKAKESFDKLLERGKMKIELPYKRKGGSKGYWIVNAVKISKDRYLGFAEDVTERKKAEQRLKDLLEERENIIHRLSHDLKTPVSPLVNLIPMVKDKVGKKLDDEIIQKDLEICEKNALYLKELLEHILKIAEYSKSGRKTGLQSVQVKELVEDWLSNFKGRNLDEIEEKWNIEFRNEIELDTRIEVDKMGLFEVFDNLAKNSLEHLSKEGKMFIGAEEKEDSVIIKFRDTGGNLEEEELENIFKYFYTTGKTKHKLESTGLGLPISKYIIENHNGNIWAERSEDGKGTVFCIELPKEQKEML